MGRPSWRCGASRRVTFPLSLLRALGSLDLSCNIHKLCRPHLPVASKGSMRPEPYNCLAGAAAASSHTASSAGPLVRPQLAKRAVYSSAQQKQSQIPKPPRGSTAPSSCIGNATAAVVSPGSRNGTIVTAESDAGQPQTTRWPAKPSLAKRKHAASQPVAVVGPAAAAFASCCGADHTATESAAAPQLLPQPSTAARPNFAHQKAAAAKPPAAKRRAGASKAPALGTITEVGVSPPEPLASAAPTNLIAAAAPASSLGSSHGAATAASNVSCQPPATAKPAARQRTKAADLDGAAVHAKVVQKHAEGKLAELTVPEAKCWLKGRKLPLKGKKEELVARIMEALLQA